MALCILQIIDVILLPHQGEPPAREITIVQLVGGEIPAIDETIRSNGNTRQVVVTIRQMVTSTVRVLRETRVDRALEMIVEGRRLRMEEADVYGATVLLM